MSDIAGKCHGCSAPLVRKARGRPQTKYCSRTCKEVCRSPRNPKVAKQNPAKLGRICTQCNGPISPTVSIQAKTCSRACGVTYQNRRRQEAKRAAWETTKPPCERCGAEIPVERFRNSKFCSVLCKRRTTNDRWRAKNPHHLRQYLYGLKPGQYEALVDAQDDRCAICRTDRPGGKGGWHVDHCHTSGAVRGLLCHHCNIAVGYFKDSPALILAGIEYLERTAVQVPQAA